MPTHTTPQVCMHARLPVRMRSRTYARSHVRTHKCPPGLDSLLQSGAVAGGNKTVYLEAVNRVEHCSAVLFRGIDIACARFFAVSLGLGAREFVAEAVEHTIPAHVDLSLIHI